MRNAVLSCVAAVLFAALPGCTDRSIEPGDVDPSGARADRTGDRTACAGADVHADVHEAMARPAKVPEAAWQGALDDIEAALGPDGQVDVAAALSGPGILAVLDASSIAAIERRLDDDALLGDVLLALRVALDDPGAGEQAYFDACAVLRRCGVCGMTTTCGCQDQWCARLAY